MLEQQKKELVPEDLTEEDQGRHENESQNPMKGSKKHD
jgi:hypothetical protein